MHFTLQTSHKPLLTLFNENKAISPQASGQIQCWALTLASFKYSITCRGTSQHANADAMSYLLLPNNLVESPLSGELMLMVERLQTAPILATQIAQWTCRDSCFRKCYSTYILVGQPHQTTNCDHFGAGDWNCRYTMIVFCLVTGW